MGWLFGWATRAQLVDHLVNDNGVKTLKKCFKGNNMWAVQEYEREDGSKIVFACQYLIKGPPYGNPNDRHGWGYKDVDETMGPYSTDFPVSWLDLLTEPHSEYAVAWRQAVRDRAARIAQFKLGTRWQLNGNTYTIAKRRSPTSFRCKDEYGDLYRVSVSTLLGATQITGEQT